MFLSASYVAVEWTPTFLASERSRKFLLASTFASGLLKNEDVGWRLLWLVPLYICHCSRDLKTHKKHTHLTYKWNDLYTDIAWKGKIIIQLNWNWCCSRSHIHLTWPVYCFLPFLCLFFDSKWVSSLKRHVVGKEHFCSTSMQYYILFSPSSALRYYVARKTRLWKDCSFSPAMSLFFVFFGVVHKFKTQAQTRRSHVISHSQAGVYGGGGGSIGEKMLRQRERERLRKTCSGRKSGGWHSKLLSLKCCAC